MSWTKCLPLVLLRLRTQPQRDIRLSAYELLYGVEFTPVEICMNVLSSRDRLMQHFVHKLSQYLDHCRKHGLLAQTPPLEFPVHKIQIRDWVLIRCWKEEKLQPKWERTLPGVVDLWNRSPDKRKRVDPLYENKRISDWTKGPVDVCSADGSSQGHLEKERHSCLRMIYTCG